MTLVGTHARAILVVALVTCISCLNGQKVKDGAGKTTEEKQVDGLFSWKENHHEKPSYEAAKESLIRDRPKVAKYWRNPLAAPVNVTRKDILEHSSVSPVCQADFDIMWNAFMAGDAWAHLIVDSWGKSESGFNWGNTVLEGRMSQCELQKTKIPGTTGENMRGKYCAIVWHPLDIFGNVVFEEPRQYGICLPQTCGTDDVYSLIGTYGFLDPVYGYPPPEYEPILNKYCTEDLVIKKDPSAIGAIAVLSFFGLLAVIGTLYDAITRRKRKPRKKQDELELANRNNNAVGNHEDADKARAYPTEQLPNGNTGDYPPADYHGYPGQTVVEAKVSSEEVYKPNTCEQLMLSFSVYTNVPKLASFDHAPGSFKCVNGIRFLTMAWIVLGHTWQLGITVTPSPVGVIENRRDISLLQERGTFMVVRMSNIAVETFFVLSAMLTTISLMKRVKKYKGKPPCATFGYYYFHRYWRLTPVYMLILMFWSALFIYLGSGPVYPGTIPELQGCKRGWWKHMLYLNNWIGEDWCMGWSWYLANDFQFYLIAPAFISLLIWVPIAGVVMTLLGLFGGLVATAYLNHGLIIRGDVDFMADIYIKAYTRCSPYFLGIFLGYLMFKTNCKAKIHAAGVVFAWIGALAAISIAIYVEWDSFKDFYTDMWPPEVTVFFMTIQRILFSLGVFWIIFACCSGYGGIINDILSWRGWVPLAKLSYTGYLIHPIVIYYTYYTTPVQIYMTDLIMIYYYIGHLLLTLGISFVVSIFLEMPFTALERVMFQNVRK